MSYFDDKIVELNKDNLEHAIEFGMTKQQILVKFDITANDLDKWCLENYGKNFLYVFERVKIICLENYQEAVLNLGLRGSPSALALADSFIRQAQKDNVVKIVFENKLDLESEEDKEND